MNHRMFNAAVGLAACIAFGNVQAADVAKGGQTAASALGSALPIGAVAVVNGVQVKQQQLDAVVAASKQPDTPALRTALKNELIAQALLVQAAENAHYDKHADVEAAVTRAKALAMSQAYLRDSIKVAPIGEADVKAEYDKIISTLGDTEYKASVIVTNDADTAGKVIDLLKKNGDFAQLAKQYSVASDAAQGGALNWVSFKTPLEEGKTQNWPLPVADALLKLPLGGVSAAPTPANGKFYVLRLEQKRPIQVPEYEKVKPVLTQQLQQAALQKATAAVVVGLLKTAKIQQ